MMYELSRQIRWRWATILRNTLCSPFGDLWSHLDGACILAREEYSVKLSLAAKIAVTRARRHPSCTAYRLAQAVSLCRPGGGAWTL